jgi:hypothetical protein
MTRSPFFKTSQCYDSGQEISTCARGLGAHSGIDQKTGECPGFCMAVTIGDDTTAF